MRETKSQRTPPTIVLFDVDGTLVRGASCERRFIRHLLKRGMLGPKQLAAMGWFIIRNTPQFGRHVSRKNKAYLTGLERGPVEHAASQYINEVILADLSEIACERLRKHQQRGDRVALLTGGPDFLARPLAAALGVEHFQATICAERDGTFLIRPPIIHPLGRDKALLGSELCSRLGGCLADAAAYADSIFDLPLLESVRTPIAVQPDARLAAIARQRGWEILNASESAAMPSGAVAPRR